jgi:hypothetical protein
MARKTHTPEQIIGTLREAEVRLSQGENAGSICRTLGVSIATSTFFIIPIAPVKNRRPLQAHHTQERTECRGRDCHRRFRTCYPRPSRCFLIAVNDG